MTTIKKPWIKLKETIDREDYDIINKLQEQCIRQDKTELKLELDYKLGVAFENNKSTSIQDINEFMYFDGQEIIGYIGIGSFGGSDSPLEVNGMVHPQYRRQGVFKTLWEMVIAEWKRRGSKSMLLLSDRKSNSGQGFIKKTGAQYKNSEYEMYLKKTNIKPLKNQLYEITFRKATNSDTYEIVRQNAIYFSDKFHNYKDIKSNESDMISVEEKVTISTEGMILPEEEEKRGMKTYIVEKDQQIIGKVNLQLISGIGGIYGLGVLPEHRRKGFGRAILMMAVEKLKELNARDIMLQVAAENSNALNLYKSCGFVETSTMDYYEYKA